MMETLQVRNLISKLPGLDLSWWTMLPSLKLTANAPVKMGAPRKRRFLLENHHLLRGYVSFRECKLQGCTSCPFWAPLFFLGKTHWNFRCSGFSWGPSLDPSFVPNRHWHVPGGKLQCFSGSNPKKWKKKKKKSTSGMDLSWLVNLPACKVPPDEILPSYVGINFINHCKLDP